MKLHLASLAAALLLAACSSTPAAIAPDAGPPPAPPVATTPAPGATADAGSIDGATFEAALAAAHLTPMEIPGIKREMTHEPPSEPVKIDGRRIELVIAGGFNAETLEFARDAAGHVVRVVRSPVVTVKEIVIQGCQESAFAGGRAWFDRVTFELPAGTTWGGERTVKYPVVKEITRYTGKKANGEACPPPQMMMD